MAYRDMAQSDSAYEPRFFDPAWGHYAPTRVQAALTGLTRRTFLQRGKARYWMTKAITGLGTPLDITFNGLRYRITGRNNLIEYGLLTRPGYNRAEIDFLCAGLPQGGAAVDIGCNIGLYTLPMAQAVGAGGKVVGIDANPEMIRHMGLHADMNGLAQVQPMTVAVGAEVKRVALEISKDDVAIVRVRETPEGPHWMKPLSHLLADAGLTRLDALKIDIEGHEDAALVPYLQGAPDALRPARIVIEHIEGKDYPGCAAIFAELGYRRVGQTRNNSMYLRETA